MPRHQIQLNAPDLFGNEAAEDEAQDVFQAYAVRRPEITRFADASFGIAIVRAYKGEGKSALLRLTQLQVTQANPDAIILHHPASMFAPAPSQDFNDLKRKWKAALFARLANEIGAQLNTAWNDDTIALVEESERQGFKRKGLLSSILSRFKLTAKVGPTAGVELGLSRELVGPANVEETIKRVASNREPIWFLIDDVDQNIRASAEEKARAAAFFVAIRELINSVPEIRVRATVRPTTWTIIKPEFEALSHVEQYISDLDWPESAIGTLLAKRVEGYLRRRTLFESFEVPADRDARQRYLMALVFDDPMPWGGGGRMRPPNVPLSTLSMHRPRWVVELCKVSAQAAVDRGAHRVGLQDLTGQLESFGNRRIQDTIAEFKAQCPQLEELIAAFRGEREEMTTAEFLSVIQNKILTHLSPRISGVPGAPHAMDVAAFLFQVGIFFAREESGPGGGYNHYSFRERPHLLRSRTSLDDGCSWELHPVFRQALGVRGADGGERRVARSRSKAKSTGRTRR